MSNIAPETGGFFARDRQWHPPAHTPPYKTTVLRSPRKALLSLDATISEITGPVFGHGMVFVCTDLASDRAHGRTSA